jgi:hypothetical protein
MSNRQLTGMRGVYLVAAEMYAYWNIRPAPRGDRKIVALR